MTPDRPKDAAVHGLREKLKVWREQRLSERFPWLNGHHGAIELTAVRDRDALRQILRSGWHVQDRGAIWSGGQYAYMDLPVIRPGMTTRIEVNLMPFIEPEKLPGQSVSITRDAEILANWLLDRQEFQWHCFVIEEHGAYLTRIKWNLPSATMPISIGVGSDKRELAVAIAAIRLTQVPSGSSCETGAGNDGRRTGN